MLEWNTDSYRLQNTGAIAVLEDARMVNWITDDTYIMYSYYFPRIAE